MCRLVSTMAVMRSMLMTLALGVVASAQSDVVNFAAAPAPAAAYKSVSDGSNKKIGMVISTLKDILQSVTNEEKEETVMYNKYMGWCTSQRAAIAGDLSDAKTNLANAKVLSEEQVSSIDSLTLFVKKNEQEMEDTKDAVAQAVALRTEEADKYTEEMQLNTQSLRQIDLAIKHVGKVNKQGGFLQNGVMKKLTVNQPGESNYVLGIMKGLKAKLDKTRAELKSVEADKVKMHDSFMQTKGLTMKALTDTTTAKKIELAETTAKEAGTKRKISKLTDEVSTLQTEAAKTTETCQTTKTEWTVRQADRTKEKAALNEAIRYLTQTALEQLSLVQKHTADKSDEDQASVVFAPSFLQEASDSQSAGNAFYAAASAELNGEDEEVEGHMQKDTFNGVQKVVMKLIGTHGDTQKEETTKKKYCENEISSKDDEKATVIDNLAAVKANIEKKEAEVVTLTDEVKTLYNSIDQIKTSLEAAGKIRKQENSLFKAGTKDRTLAIKVLNQAMTVLQDFYSKGNLLQGAAAPAPARGAAPSKWTPVSPRKKVANFGAVSMVQDVADDIAKEQKDAAVGEGQAVSVFEQLQADSKQRTDDAHQDVTDRVMAKAKLGVNINTLKETRTQMNDDLKSINSQLDALHKSCDELLQFYDKRVKARTFEVSQLRDVMDILSGSSVAARTGLVQQDEGATETGSDEESADSETDTGTAEVSQA